VRRGAQLAALLELLADDPSAATDAIAVESMLAWTPPATAMPLSRLAAGLATAGLAFSAVVIGLHGESSAVVYPEHDAIRPGGEKRDREAIVDFMETEVLPWAQVTLGPLKGGADRVGCETCHGVDPDSRNWTMPSVAALPEPQVQQYGSEHVDTTVDAQMRNAMYGYLAESDKQAKAAYMRQVIVPGMARLLGRPAYDFTRTYEYNRTHFAIGCYHCHRVEGELRN
jgi:cytochrome c553